MDSAQFVYDLAARLNDGSEVLLNPEEHGWAEPERLSKVEFWSIVPRVQGEWPVVSVHIPEGAKPIFKSRVYGKGLPNSGAPSFRAYAIGYHDSESHWTWVLPGGVIEQGTEEPVHAHLMLEHIGAVMRAHREEQERLENEKTTDSGGSDLGTGPADSGTSGT